MAAEYQLLCRRITLTSANNSIRFSDGTGRTATVAEGTYYLDSGNGGIASTLLTAIVTALDATASALTFDAVLSVLTTSAGPTASISIQASGSFTLLQSGTTFPVDVIGFSVGDHVSSGNAIENDLSPSGLWIADQPEVERDPLPPELDVTEHERPDGSTTLFTLGAEVSRRRLRHLHVWEDRVWAHLSPTDEDRAFESFWRNAITEHAPMRLYRISSGATPPIATISSGEWDATDLVDTLVFTGESVRRPFLDLERVDNAQLYAFDVETRSYV